MWPFDNKKKRQSADFKRAFSEFVSAETLDNLLNRPKSAQPLRKQILGSYYCRQETIMQMTW